MDTSYSGFQLPHLFEEFKVQELKNKIAITGDFSRLQ